MWQTKAHRVAVLVPDQVIGLDLAIPCHVFDSTVLPSGEQPYEVRVCGSKTVDAKVNVHAEYRIIPPWRLADAREADTVIVPGMWEPASPPARAVVELVRSVHARGGRVASVCTGAFVLAAAGLLDGRRATTHWDDAGDLARCYPDVQVDPDVLYVDDEGRVLTSAGVAAGLDMCLHMVAADFGASVAARTARRIVVPVIRDGGQAQFITHELPDDTAPVLQPTLSWMSDHLGEQLTLEDIAEHAAMSIRTLNRRFREHVGTSPLQWLLMLRVERAKELLETTDLSIERIADEVGFGSSVTLRHHFTRRVRVPPQRYRAAFRSPEEMPSAS
jgi:transcriptional regulator GlxA family with amidase domain